MVQSAEYKGEKVILVLFHTIGRCHFSRDLLMHMFY